MTEQKKFTIVPVIQRVVTGFKKVPVYNFYELSEDVQQRLIDDEMQQRQEGGVNYFPWLDDNFDSFYKTAEILNIKAETEADEYGATIHILRENNNEYVDMCDITGLRAYKYIINNFLPGFCRAKYYSLNYNEEKHYYPARHSKCQFNYDGDGYYLDLIVNNVWQEMKRSIIKKKLSVMDFIQAVVDEYTDEISQDIIYFFSSQGVREDLSGRGYLYFKDGEIAE